jgi:hypothetical protein
VVDVFSGKPVSVKMLGPEWRHRMIDVCGVGVFRRKEERLTYITHLDLDHLPLKEYVLGAKIRFFTASKFMRGLEAFYGGAFDVCEYNDVLMLKHTTISGKRKIVEKETCAFFIGEAMIIPECDDPDKLIMEYRPKFAFIFVSQQSHQHPVSFNNHRRDVFILHNKVWTPYAPNVIPKIVFSSTEEDKKMFTNYVAKGV